MSSYDYLALNLPINRDETYVLPLFIDKFRLRGEAKHERQSRSQSETGNAIFGAAASLASGSSPKSIISSPEAGNEVSKGFELNLTLMGKDKPLPAYSYHY
ncbi:hypothetical protein [Nostoc commune]|uniref:hypothetical protein n=1 Tax=Nostoc commune TaxID=1178 RepID=UPI0020735E2C|nr:hypothetical protein [Nostoc commune]